MLKCYGNVYIVYLKYFLQLSLKKVAKESVLIYTAHFPEGLFLF